MNRSLISWNPIDPQAIATRAHVTSLVLSTAQRAGVDLPPPVTAGEFARDKHFGFDVARSRVSTDCAAALPATIVPPEIGALIFGAPPAPAS